MRKTPGEGDGIASAAGCVVTPEDALRAHLYRFVAAFLTAPPDANLLAAAAAINAGESAGKEPGRDDDVVAVPALTKTLTEFAAIAARSDPRPEAEAFHDLFIGIGRGELLPFGSYYLTGFLHEKPLAKLRTEMARLGIERRPDVKEPEDHIASLCETMAGLIDGAFEAPATLGIQQKFFEEHLHSWAPHFFRDLENTDRSELYAKLGEVGQQLMAIEARNFTMA